MIDLDLDLARLSSPASLRTLTIGEHRLTYLPDGHARWNPHEWLPEADTWTLVTHRALIDTDGYLAGSVGALLIEHHERAMLIDAGCGPVAVPTEVGDLSGGDLLTSLHTAGKTSADIELIALTQLQPDHTGWLIPTQPDHATPVFDNARVLINTREWARNSRTLPAEGLLMPGHTGPAAAYDIQLVKDGTEIFPGVRQIPLPGHSRGHCGYLIESDGQRLLAFGDALTTPIQITHPSLTHHGTQKRRRARATAHRVLTELVRPDTTGFGMAFADIQFGQLTTIDGRHRWTPTH